MESDAKQAKSGLVLPNGKCVCVFEDWGVFETKSLLLTKKIFQKILSVRNNVSALVKEVGKSSEVIKQFENAKISRLECSEMDASWLEDIGITKALRKINLPTNIRT